MNIELDSQAQPYGELLFKERLTIRPLGLCDVPLLWLLVNQLSQCPK